MQRHSGPSTMHGYAVALGDALISLRRRLNAGQRTGRRVNRPQRIVRHVYPDNAPAPSPDREGGAVPPPTAHDPVPSPPAIAQAEAMAAYTRSLLEPLVAHVSGLETTIRDQAETIGRMSAQLEA